MDGTGKWKVQRLGGEQGKISGTKEQGPGLIEKEAKQKQKQKQKLPKVERIRKEKKKWRTGETGIIPGLWSTLLE